MSYPCDADSKPSRRQLIGTLAAAAAVAISTGAEADSLDRMLGRK
jgi:hypothetical protein